MDESQNIIWNEVLEILEKNVPRAQFVTLLKSTSLISLNETSAIIAAPSVMIVDMIKKRFLTEISTAILEKTGRVIDVSIITKTSSSSEKIESGPLFSLTKENLKPIVGHLPRVRPEYTFENFAVSGSNQLAFVSANTVASNIGVSYNPFFIYGPVGVGKTHLMHAIANNVYNKNPNDKIIYITSEEFTNEVVEAIRTNDTSRMKRRFRTAKLLLIDDIQFIEGKERVQEELFHTFNFLIDNTSQICLSSDRPPHEIKKLEKRLSSRFSGGLTVDIGAPDLELKTAILEIKAKKYNADLPMDVAMFLADQVEDTRSLEGLLLRVITQATTKDLPISMDLARSTIGLTQEEKRLRIHPDDVISAVCEFYSIKSTQIKGPKRDAFLVKARQVSMYLLKNQLRLTLSEIGNLLGGRDHTTIMHGVEKIESLVDNKSDINEDILRINKILSG